MRRRRLLLAVGTATLLGVSGFALVLWLTAPTPGVSQENFRRLRWGMSASDVEALLGGPHETHKERDGFSTAKWQCEEVTVSLWFDEDHLVSGIAQWQTHAPGESIPPPESFLDRIRRLLHL